MIAKFALAAVLGASAPAAAPASDNDPALRALVDGVARARSLQMENLSPPYFVAGYVNDRDAFDVGASFGALTYKGRGSRSEVNTLVRVGTPDLDNTNFSGGGYFEGFSSMGPAAPEHADYDALRNVLWLRFDAAYKRGIEALARKKAYLETNSSTERPADFAPAPLAGVVQPRAKLSVDEARWTRLVKSASAVFRDAPGVTSGQARFHASAANQCFASSDPVVDRFGDTMVELSIGATMQAPDGMDIEAHEVLRGRSEADLPKDAEVEKVAHRVLDRLQALAKAPALPEDYSGPVLFTGRAAAQFFLRGVGLPLSQPREMLGASAEGRLVDRFKKHVLTSNITVRDDPTQRTYKNAPLLGWYAVDDDGVKPQAITLVDKGVLETFPMSRVPTRKVAASNGHSRNGQGGVSNLFVEATGGKPRDALKKQLIQLAKENDCEYGILVEDLADGAMSRDEDFGFMGGGSGGGDIRLSAPSVAYRVFPDGREELVRGASFKSVSFHALRDIVGVGKDVTVLNTTALGQPVAVVAPSVLVKELELRKPPRDFEKLPAIDRPVTASK